MKRDRIKEKCVCIIVPTYNESKNIGPLLQQLLKVGATLNSNYSLKVLIVDDNSPDKTWAIVKAFRKKYPNIFLLKREKKEGLGAAYLAGFKYAFAKIKPDIIIQMDADLSHPPEKIPAFLKEIENGSDMVIGSRYIKEGGCKSWSLFRKIVSKGANKFGGLVLNLKINDISSGFRCYKASLLKSVDLNSIECKGYSFLEELLFLCKKKGAKIKEVPFLFVDRVRGKTKLTKKEMINFFVSIIKIRLRDIIKK